MKKVLIIVDFQNDFVSGSLGFPQAASLSDRIEEKMKAYLKEDQDLIFTFDTHEDAYLKTNEGRHLPVLHCVKGTEGWELYGQIRKYQKQARLCLHKDTFGSAELLSYLRAGEYTSVELVGLVSHICVLANAVLAKTALTEADIIIDASCTASFDADLHEKALDIMEGLQMIVINREET